MSASPQLHDDRPRVDTRLYVLVDPAVPHAGSLAELAAQAADGGATLIQLRDKDGDTRAMIDSARDIVATLDGRADFVINDRVDVALASGADGVHLGQDDMHPADARRLLGPDAIIGLTIKNLDHVKSAPLDVIDYCAIGGVFETSSKDNPDAPVGLDGLLEMTEALRARGFPGAICAIAGITLERAGEVVAAGADGICVVSAVISANDPQDAAAALRLRVDEALAGRGA
ncbi:thiamine phosphate synthase [Tepidamorphus sp. 3E244]|uniref:thiamine phosphate synthase n=1 Tax=Tepidamorphus sp. 3E244 TaxID=3385498 RepID=UPI0038FD193F